MSLRLLTLFLLTATILRADVPLSDVTISSAVHKQSAPSIASDGEGYYCVWLDERSGIFVERLFGNSVSADARMTDPIGTPLARQFTDPSPSRRSAVVWNGHEYVIVFGNGFRDFEAVRVNRSGELVDAEPVQLTDREYPGIGFLPLAVSNGRSLLVSAIPRLHQTEFEP